MKDVKLNKLEYHKPKLIIHGKIEDITLATGQNPTYTDGAWDNEGNLYPGDKGSII